MSRTEVNRASLKLDPDLIKEIPEGLYADWLVQRAAAKVNARMPYDDLEQMCTEAEADRLSEIEYLL